MTNNNVTDVERAKYQRAWVDERYRIACHSLRLWDEHREWFPPQFTTALDIGCGLGYLLARWNQCGIDTWGVDIADNCLDGNVWQSKFVQSCLWEMKWNRRFDLGICCDVMEHIPSEYVAETLRRIASCCDEVLFKIAHEPNSLNGDILHLTLQPYEWWMDTINTWGGSAEYLGTVERSGNYDSIIRWRVRR